METSRKDRSHFALAQRVAALSEYGKFKHGAVLVRRGRVVNVGHNKDRPVAFGSRFRHPDTGQATLHAELSAILNVPRSCTDGADIFVVRLGKKGDLRNSKPCPMCQAAMRFVGIKRVFFTAEGGNLESMKL